MKSLKLLTLTLLGAVCGSLIVPAVVAWLVDRRYPMRPLPHRCAGDLIRAEAPTAEQVDEWTRLIEILMGERS